MKKVTLLLIKFYQVVISPFKIPTCRFYPTCSHYFYQAIEKHGVPKGSYKGIKRLLCCHPFHPGGYHPVE